MKTNGEYRLLDLIFKKLAIKIVFDVGANKGDYAGHILSYKKNIKIYCFEPDPQTFQNLKENTSSSSDVVIENCALGDSIGTREMYINKDAPELNSFYDMEQKNYNVEKTSVPTDSLDEYCKKNQIMHIDLLKVDTEGHELFVLRGGSHLFQDKAIDLVQFEFGNASAYAKVFFRDIYDFLVDKGYEIYKVKPLNLEKVSYIPEYEKIMYANFIAVKKGISLE